jgi:hypothetical protein
VTLAQLMQLPQNWNIDRYHDMQATLDAPCPLVCPTCHGVDPVFDPLIGPRFCLHGGAPTWADVINAGVSALSPTPPDLFGSYNDWGAR